MNRKLYCIVPPNLLSDLGGIKGGILFLCLLLLGCSSGPADPVLASVGTTELTRSQLSAISGVPWDSLKSQQKWSLIHSWIERTLIEQEGIRMGVDKDPALLARLDEVKSELIRARLLQKNRPVEPADSTIENYYNSRTKEFLRVMDCYVVESFWAESQSDLNSYISAMAVGDSSLVENGTVSNDGRWLAGADELDAVVVADLSKLKSGQFTKLRPHEDGFRVLRLMESYPAGTPLALSAVKEEIKMRMMIEMNRQTSDNLMTDLRNRYPVAIYMEDPK